MSRNIFLRDESFYQRDLNPVGQYIDQSSFFISRMKGIPFEEVKEKIREKLKVRAFPEMRDPMVQYYERHDYEDREITYTPLTQFLKTITIENLTMAPSLTCYVNASEKKSILSGFTDDNVKLRNVAKKDAAKWKAQGDMDKFRHFNGEQENKKLYNNALSGAFSSGGSIVRNPSAHSTLTSTTRTMTSIGNASNERLISGNRHYRNPKVTLNNIVVLAHTADINEIRETLIQYGIRAPTVEETMACIEFSSRLYWIDRLQTKKIEEFVSKLTPEERAAVVYTGDLYQLRILNETVIRKFIESLSHKVTEQDFENPIEIIKATDEMYINYVHQICMSEVRGIGKDYSRLSKEQQNTLAATCQNLINVLDRYKVLIKTFFLTRNLPCSVAYIRDSIRRTVVLSDTDSTMFSCDEWVQWYFGQSLMSNIETTFVETTDTLNGLNFTDEAYAVSGAVMFMATQCIAHSLAIYSANLNVERKKLFMASMKPEFVFETFALTSAGKHYFTNIVVKEGSVYKKKESEIKGVHLKSSAAPKQIVKDAQKMMMDILETPVKGKKISLNYWLNHVANIEREIKRSVLAGETTYLGRLNIKTAEAYKGSQEQSNYRHHIFWNEVFAPKYGIAPEPTYATVKFPTTLSSKRVLDIWLTQIADEAFRERMRLYLARTGRKDLNTVYISQDYISAYGVPQEIKGVIAMQSLIHEHLKAHRMILESIGFYVKEDQNLIELGY